MTDTGGHTATVRVGDYADALYYPPGSGDTRALVLNTVRIPMSAFSLDQTSIASITFLFDQKASGALVVSDMAFADEGITVAERWLVSSAM
jgi:hypothetical protein